MEIAAVTLGNTSPPRVLRVQDVLCVGDRLVIVVEGIQHSIQGGSVLHSEERACAWRVLGVGFGPAEAWLDGRAAVLIWPLGLSQDEELPLSLLPKVSEVLRLDEASMES
jgi:hypothetical protein